MIDGSHIKLLKVIPDERGRLMEILRCDDEGFLPFGQAYVTTAYPGVVKAWHFHKKQTDRFCVLSGMMKVVLYDDREGSSTRGEINEHFLGAWKPALLSIPPAVWHGFKCISETEALVLNVPTEPYDRENPDEYRVNPHDETIPYQWKRFDG